MDVRIERTETRDLQAREAIFKVLDAFNDEASGLPQPAQWLGLLIRDPATGEVSGGLWGMSYWEWLFVELLVVPPQLRGQGVGTDLMRQAEAVAKERGCRGIWLDTFSFQAPGFYEKLGFEQFGHLDDYPPGRTRFFYLKRLGVAA